MFLVFACSAIACCYLNYKFDQALSKKVFFIFIGALLLDMILFRNIFILIMSFFTFLFHRFKGYKPLECSQKKQVRSLLKNKIQEMFGKSSKNQKYDALSGEVSDQSSSMKKIEQGLGDEDIIKQAVQNYMSSHHADLNSSL